MDFAFIGSFLIAAILDHKYSNLDSFKKDDSDRTCHKESRVQKLLKAKLQKGQDEEESELMYSQEGDESLCFAKEAKKYQKTKTKKGS